ncbi:hypothetical protein E3N88_27770 [Mikania micrantha]|uniref:Protein kinase domain-containing protein n=1 Tax=Mikania micrantha TaxID=192012 RepID=A0A5N6MXL4_9ASTR|nr:hypothetical protein E3N88_27770 [Mikania micrantha]
MTILACFLLTLIPYASSISFNFTTISPNIRDQFILEGGAYISDDGIQVTPNRTVPVRDIGRVTYAQQFHLWNKNSGELASFSTNFSFVKSFDPDERYRNDDGFIFFLAQNSSMVHGAMGLQPDPTSDDSTDKYVWVEFDTYCNSWDRSSKCDHVGINLNSHASIKQTEWDNDMPSKKECQVWITYDSASKILSVLFTGFRNNTFFKQDKLFLEVDLRNELPEWVVLGFTAAPGKLFDQNTVKSWTFDSFNSQPEKKIGLIVGLTVGVSVLIVLFVMLAFVLWRRKKNNDDHVEELGCSMEMNHELELGLITGPRRFGYLELARATTGFAEEKKLGEGSFGGVYKGFLKDSSAYVAVKRVSKSSKQGIKEYASEVRIISRLRHRNLVQLTGWCHEKGELLLVYEYMENRSLDTHLFLAKSLLSWGTRYKIAIDLASAILYLHEEWKQCVLHRDIKSSNVMLDSSFNAKLGDFGLAKLVDPEKGSETTLLAGTLGYMAPECVVTGKASKESDVFSFGVVALEIVCGRKSINYKEQEKQIWLVEWVWALYGSGTIMEAVDPRLRLEFDENEAKCLMMVGLWCVHPDSRLRPSMRQVIQVLNAEASLPILPLNMPVASYTTTSSLFNCSNRDMSTSSSYLYGR